jgi:carbamate kinase
VARDPRLLVIAIGGGALRAAAGPAAGASGPPGLERALESVADLVAAGFRLVLTHGPSPGEQGPGPPGAGPEAAAASLDVVAAGAQGAVGYALQQALGNLCRQRQVEVAVAAIVTRVVVDRADPAFERPTRPVGPAYTARQARQLERDRGWTLVEEAGRRFRRLVPSPRPLAPCETELIRRLAESGVLTIACGAGGVPVIDTPAGYQGTDVVVETDHATERLATALGADRLVLLTGVECVAVAHGTPQAVGIERLTPVEARALLAAGEFPPGSMGPKVEAALRFVEEGGGSEAIITSLNRLRPAIDGLAGTHLVPEGR